ncbi:putative baseplate assembly protein [Nitrogeniibacter mangrovi]|uniref:Putative baseplate assembly protein n=2 Tax=Nitrogeniibacter mangrovi TaxID=2016596 RepID=A0A6C1B8G0_9RHOO|nr:putative baseplate assembly protein [Nitrogeniibacter mangrovi]
MLPANLQSAVEIGTPLMAMADNAEALANAPRHGALSAYQAIITQVDAALMGNFVAVTGKRQPLVRSPDTIDIMPVDDKVIAEGWALLSVPHSVELYRIVEAGVASRAEYLLAGQTTRLKLSGELPGGRLPGEFEHAPRTLAVHVQSDALALAREPLAAPVYGQTLALDHPVDGLAPGQAIALSGTRQRIRLARGVVALNWQGDDGSTRTLTGGDTLELVEAPVKLVPAPLIFGLLRYQPISLRLAGRIGPGPSTAFTLKPLGPKILVFYTPYTLAPEDFVAAIGNGALRLRLKLRDRDGAVGTATLHGDDIALEAAHEDDETVREIAFIAKGLDAITHTRDRTTVQLAEATRHVYVRLGTTVNANVAPATHGETVEAILGDGDGSRANQHFRLAQAPLTYVSAATPSGRASTLAVRVGDIRWEEADTLYDAAAHAHVFDTAQDDAAITTVRFGDGVEGARLPGGSSNVRARYRKGLGVAGNVAAGKLTTLLSRPLGVSEVLNPEAATGGEDAETLDKARDNAPLTVLTLDRAVSITDYADFARAFAGIDKAHALWIPAGPARGVFITIAGVDGAPVPTTSATYTHLLDALTEYGDPLVPIRLANYIDARFRTRIAVKVDPAHAQETVLAAIEAALNAHFGFARRAFGQTVSIDEVAAVAQAVDGVVAAHVSQLYRSGTPAEPNARLFAALPVASLTALPAAAELLTLAEPGIALELMP